MNDWLDVMLDEIARKKLEAKEAEEEQERRRQEAGDDDESQTQSK